MKFKLFLPLHKMCLSLVKQCGNDQVQQGGIMYMCLRLLRLALQLRHNGLDGVSNHQPHYCVYSAVYSCADQRKHHSSASLAFGNSPGTGEFPAQMASNAENASIWWRHHGKLCFIVVNCRWFWNQYPTVQCRQLCSAINLITSSVFDKGTSFYPSALRAGGVLSSRFGRAGGRAGGCQACGTHISVTAWRIFSIRSSMELSRPVVVHCHGNLPLCPIWACPWAKNLSNLPQIGSRLCGTHISETAGWIYPI